MHVLTDAPKTICLCFFFKSITAGKRLHLSCCLSVCQFAADFHTTSFEARSVTWALMFAVVTANNASWQTGRSLMQHFCPLLNKLAYLILLLLLLAGESPSLCCVLTFFHIVHVVLEQASGTTADAPDCDCSVHFLVSLMLSFIHYPASLHMFW